MIKLYFFMQPAACNVLFVVKFMTELTQAALEGHGCSP